MIRDQERNVENGMTKRTKNTAVLCILLMLFGTVGLFWIRTHGKQGTTVVVTADGKEYYRGSLYVEKEIKIGNGNTLLIGNGTADMIHADCPDQICVEHAPISKEGETIICLPNRVAVTIESLTGSTTEEGKGVDAIVR